MPSPSSSSSSSLLPPLLPTFTTLLKSLHIPISLPSIQSISPLLLHTTLRAILREPLPLPPLPPRSSSEHEEQRRHELEMVKLVVGVLCQRFGLDFIALKPRRVVEGREKEIEVVSRGLLLLAFLEGWTGGTGWEPVGTQPHLSPRRRKEGNGGRERVPTSSKTVAFSAFDESPPSTILPVPLTPVLSPRRPTHQQPTPPLSSSSSPPATYPEASSPLIPQQLSPPRSTTRRLLGSPPPPSLSYSTPNDSITRLTAPEEWNRRRAVETEALELAISRLVE